MPSFDLKKGEIKKNLLLNKISKLRFYCGLSFFRFFIFLLIVVLSGCCGYHFNDDTSLAAKYSTISVPYVEGDLDGSLTSAIVNELVSSGNFEYRQYGGNLILYVKIIDYQDNNIGFRYDRKKDGERRKSIIPTETRRTALAEISVEDAAANTVVLGPVQISANVAFDHDFEYARDEVNVFSLGQLSDFNQAVDAAQMPLNRILARKIVDYITSSW